MGILDSFDVGMINIDGINVSWMKEKEFFVFCNKYIGFVFQFYQLLLEFMVFENVMIFVFIVGVLIKEVLMCVMEIFDFMGLKEWVFYKLNEFFGGEKQWVVVVCVLIN